MNRLFVFMLLFVVFCSKSANMDDLLARFLGIDDVAQAYREYHVLPYYFGNENSTIYSIGQDTLSICGDVYQVSAEKNLNYIIINDILEDNSKSGIGRIGDTIQFSPNKLVMYLDGNAFICKEKSLSLWYTDKYSTSPDFIRFYESQTTLTSANAAVKVELIGKILEELDSSKR